jgi:hypothetical protein
MSGKATVCLDACFAACVNLFIRCLINSPVIITAEWCSCMAVSSCCSARAQRCVHVCVQMLHPVCDSPQSVGSSYTFIGLLTLEFTAAQSEGKVASAFIEAAGYIMIGVGVLYFFLGIACVKRVSAQLYIVRLHRGYKVYYLYSKIAHRTWLMMKSSVLLACPQQLLAAASTCAYKLDNVTSNSACSDPLSKP